MRAEREMDTGEERNVVTEILKERYVFVES